MPSFYLVGGYVRDLALGLTSKDLDFSVEAYSYAEMRHTLELKGFEIFTESEEYLTIRARSPKGPNPLGWFGLASGLPDNLTADFVLSRIEAHYTDGRRPDSVHVGSIHDDLARRDFTVNAIAISQSGQIIDPFGGEADLLTRTLRAVGDAQERFDEDALRAIRAIRFMVTKGFSPDQGVDWAMRTQRTADALKSISEERVREELLRCFKHDTAVTLHVLGRYPIIMDHVLDHTGVWLKPTSEKR